MRKSQTKSGLSILQGVLKFNFDGSALVNTPVGVLGGGIIRSDDSNTKLLANVKTFLKWLFPNEIP